MKTTFFILFSIAFACFLTLLNLALNRWKFHWKGFFFVVSYGLATGLPVAYAVMFSGEIDLPVYAAVAVVIACPFVVLETISLVKKRGSSLRSVLGIFGMLCMMSSPFFGIEFYWLPATAGAVGLCIYLFFHFRYPALNSMWLDALLREAAEAVPRDCLYTPKPITVFGENGATFVGGVFGLRVFVRKDRTVVWMKRKLHDRLGRPNLDRFAKEVAARIRENGARKGGAI